MIGTVLLYVFYALCAFIGYKTIKSYATMARRSNQGVVWMRFFPQLTDTLRFIQSNIKDSTKIPITPAFYDYFGEVLPEKIGTWLFGTPSIIFNRVSALNEIYVTKN